MLVDGMLVGVDIDMLFCVFFVYRILGYLLVEVIVMVICFFVEVVGVRIKG